MERAMVSMSFLRRRVDPWAVGALALGTVTFLAMPYTLYVLTAVVVLGLAAGLVFLFLSPALLAFQYLRYRRGSPLLSPKEG
ncbi:MAG: hypothetical protein ACE5I4_03420 [Thermoplasmata archaeon]